METDLQSFNRVSNQTEARRSLCSSSWFSLFSSSVPIKTKVKAKCDTAQLPPCLNQILSKNLRSPTL